MKMIAPLLLLLVLAHSACAPVPRERPLAFNPWLYEIWPKYEPLTDAQIQELNRPRPTWAQSPYYIDTPGKWFLRPRVAPSTTVNVHVHSPAATTHDTTSTTAR
jgi:hypothetical protein